MQLGTVLCENLSADGQPCGATAVIHEVHYKYAPGEQRSFLEVDRILTEIRRDIDCPRCGFRTQVEKISELELRQAEDASPPAAASRA